MKVTILDYGAGNVPSVERALQRLGAESLQASSPECISKADCSAPSRRRSLRCSGPCPRRKKNPRTFGRRHPSWCPFSGNLPGPSSRCLKSSEEASRLQGLQSPSRLGPRLAWRTVKLPHMGWDQLTGQSGSLRGCSQASAPARIFISRTLSPCSYCSERQTAATRATCSYGAEFAAVIEQEQYPSRCNSIRKKAAKPDSVCTAEFSADRGMSLARRIIPCLDTDGERVVKGVNFVALRDAGDPVTLARRYNAEGADELVVLDIAASRDRRPTFPRNNPPRRGRIGHSAHRWRRHSNARTTRARWFAPARTKSP